jgi:hypothetical protein
VKHTITGSVSNGAHGLFNIRTGVRIVRMFRACRAEARRRGMFRGFKHFPSSLLASGAATFYNFPPQMFHHFELSPPKIKGTLTTFRKGFKINALRKTRTIRLSQTFPLDGGTVATVYILTKSKYESPRSSPLRATNSGVSSVVPNLRLLGKWLPPRNSFSNPYTNANLNSNFAQKLPAHSFR